MSPPSVRVNTFVKENEKLYVDPLSKMFIILQCMFGLYRIPLLVREKYFHLFLFLVIYVIFMGIIIGLSMSNGYYPLSKVIWCQIPQNIICVLLSITQYKWIRQYYTELNTFDTEAGCRPKCSNNCIRNAVQALLSCLFILIVYTMPKQIGVVKINAPQFAPLFLLYFIEVHYFGHLLGLLIPRLKLINYYLESSLSGSQPESNPLLKQFVYFKSYDIKTSQSRMRKLMDLYQIVANAHDCLIEGIKWQLLVNIISAFVTVLGLLYTITLFAIRSSKSLTESAMQVLLSTLMMLPLFPPCAYGDSLHKEVKKLRELLASRLYENKLDKCGRSVARALLAFTDTRDLSFRLLRMVNIDISLPFNFLGLIVTYLIILLQFEKVINP